MAESVTTRIRACLDRLRDGDEAAREALLAAACGRLERLTRKMLRDFPAVRRWDGADDVLQDALIRLDRALRSVRPETPRDFFRLSAAQIRRELIDLARKYGRTSGFAKNHATPPVVGERGGDSPVRDPADGSSRDPFRLAEWTEFHRLVGALPEEDREVFDLLWYQGLTQAEAAEALGVSARTVHRRWVAARVRLGDALGERPGIS